MLIETIVSLRSKASRNIYALMNAGIDVYCWMCGRQGKAFMKGNVSPIANQWQDIV